MSKLTLFALILTASPVLALSPDRSLRQFTVSVWQAKDGLPSGAIRSLSQAPDGTMWIAALGGVARYDGERFLPFKSDSAARPVITNVSTMFATRDGNVWLEANGHQPIRIRGEQAVLLGAESGLPGGFEVSAWDDDDQGIVWMLGGDQLFRAEGDRFVSFAVRGLESHDITELHVGDAHYILVGTRHGLLKVVEGELVPVAAIPTTAAVSVLHADRSGTVWASAGGHLYGIRKGQPALSGGDDGMPFTHVAQMDDDSDGNLWVATDAGLVRRRASGQFELFTVEDGLPDNDIADVVVDREGTLWVATRNGGVAQFTDRTLDTVPRIAALDGVQVDSVCEDAEAALWFATRGNGAVRWKAGRASTYTTNEGLPSNHVNAVLPGDSGEVWLGTKRGLRRFGRGVVSDPGITDRPVTALFQDRQGALWVGGEGELTRFDGERTVLFAAADGIPAGEVRALAEDGAGVLWVSAGDGLVRREGGRFAPSALPGGARLGQVEGLLADRRGALWLSSTTAGLWRLANGQLSFFDVEAAAGADTLYGLIEDDAGDLWIGTNRSIARISRASLEGVASGGRPGLEVVSYENTDRRQSIVAAGRRQPGSFRAHDGQLWFATRQGPLSIDPRRAHPNAAAPTVAISSVRVDGRDGSKASPPHFPAGAGNVAVQFSGVTLLDARRARYRYRLDGHDREWTAAKMQRTAEYTGLGPGEYHFRVQAANGDGIWNPTEATAAFVIEPPFRRTPLFYGLCLFALALMGVIAHRVHLARLRSEFALLLSERNRMARTLHDTVLQGMSAVAVKLNAMGTRLTDAPPALADDLSQLQETVTRCLEQTRGVVWETRERARGEGNLSSALERLVQRLCEHASVGATVEVDGAPVPLPREIEDELFLIAQEAVTNALKHAAPQRITVRLRYGPSLVALTVSDDGRGFDADQAGVTSNGHFGLVGLHERANRLGAALQVQSEPGEGTTIGVVISQRGRQP